MNKVIKNPHISEKSFADASVGKYCFLVSKNINKFEAKSKIEEMFSVNVIKINSSIIQGKIKSVKGKKGKRSDVKKITFSLKKNQKIDLFEVEKLENEKVLDRKADHKKLFSRDNTKSQVDRARNENDPTALSMQGGGK